MSARQQQQSKRYAQLKPAGVWHILRDSSTVTSCGKPIPVDVTPIAHRDMDIVVLGCYRALCKHCRVRGACGVTPEERAGTKVRNAAQKLRDGAYEVAGAAVKYDRPVSDKPHKPATKGQINELTRLGVVGQHIFNWDVWHAREVINQLKELESEKK